MKKILIPTVLMLLTGTLFAAQPPRAKKQKPLGPEQERIFSLYNSTDENVKIELTFQDNKKQTFELNPGEEQTETMTVRPVMRYKLFVKKPNAADFEQMINQKTHLSTKSLTFAVTLTQAKGSKEKSNNLIVGH